jgi:hypothetical protein
MRLLKDKVIKVIKVHPCEREIVKYLEQIEAKRI